MMDLYEIQEVEFEVWSAKPEALGLLLYGQRPHRHKWVTTTHRNGQPMFVDEMPSWAVVKRCECGAFIRKFEEQDT